MDLGHKIEKIKLLLEPFYGPRFKEQDVAFIEDNSEVDLNSEIVLYINPVLNEAVYKWGRIFHRMRKFGKEYRKIFKKEIKITYLTDYDFLFQGRL
ncbi:MAG: hypothetical protein KC516_02770 [Nanoarchaeota archaeon]|nr:hypothetical protein [Nanoarchaeota archaeon]